MKNTAIVIPTYNEKKNILKLTDKILKLIPKCNIYIVDDTKNLNMINFFRRKKKLNIF